MLPSREWTLGGLNKLLRKIDETHSVDRKSGNGRPKTAITENSIDAVEELIQSQEDEESGSHTDISHL